MRWFRILALAFALATPAFAQAPQQLAWPLNQVSVPEEQSADTVSNFVFVPSGATTGNAKALYSLTVKIGATSGYVMVFDATALPSNGAITPCTNTGTTRPCQLWCYPINSNGTNGAMTVQWMSPMLGSSGIVAGFSTTGCDTITASATAKFMGQAL